MVLEVDPHYVFHVCDGTTIKNLEELGARLKRMSMEAFSYHVTSTKNDFATWVADCMNDKSLSVRLLKCNDSRHMCQVIGERIAQIKAEQGESNRVKIKPETVFNLDEVRSSIERMKQAVVVKDYVHMPESKKEGLSVLENKLEMPKKKEVKEQEVESSISKTSVTNKAVITKKTLKPAKKAKVKQSKSSKNEKPVLDLAPEVYSRALDAPASIHCGLMEFLIGLIIGISLAFVLARFVVGI